MAVDKNWAVTLFFDVVSASTVSLSESEFSVRAALSPEWAVWGRPTGVVNHNTPHVAGMSYIPMSVDPIEVLSDVAGWVELKLIRDFGGTLPLVFAGSDIKVVPAVDINWAPAVRGTAA